MITPPPLTKGDTIGLVSTARKISLEELEPAIKILEAWGLKVQTSAHLFEEHHQFAGTDEQRLADLQGFIDSPDIKAILCVRGGYGTVRVIDDLDLLSILHKPKWICGYSDVTILLSKLLNKGFESIHSTMPINFSSNTSSALSSLKEILFGEAISYDIPSHPFNRMGKTKGKLIGGNLSIIYSQLGSPTDLKTDGAVLFIEDLDEYLYHIDRMMMNLKRNGYFENLAGLVIGGMSDMNDNAIPFGKTALEIIRDTVVNYNFPVCFGFPAGHLDDNRALIMGRKVILDVANSVSLSFSDG
jgi:muramoyltetrapeptide carboxypeptidase